MKVKLKIHTDALRFDGTVKRDLIELPKEYKCNDAQLSKQLIDADITGDRTKLPKLFDGRYNEWRDRFGIENRVAIRAHLVEVEFPGGWKYVLINRRSGPNEGWSRQEDV